MEGFVSAVNVYFADINEHVRLLLVSLNLEPEKYIFLFPADKSVDIIRNLVANNVFPTFPKLAPALTYTILLSLARYVLQHTILKPLAIQALKIRFVEAPVGYDPRIEKAFPSSAKTIEGTKVEKYSKISGIAESVLHKYLWARKKNLVKKRKVTKFVEASWRFVMYLLCCVVGYYTLFVPVIAPYVKKTDLLWEGWPQHEVTPVMEFYYLFQLASYLHQLLWTEVNRSDATEMIIHHLSTILLLVFSYLTNFTRVGAYILLLHDASDVLLESAKCFNYAAKTKGQEFSQVISEAIFVVFAITFVVTRIVLYPHQIIASVFFEAPKHFGTNWVGYWVFCVLLVILQCLHVFWTYLIGRMVYRLVTTGFEKDERSDDEEDEEDDGGDDGKENK